MKYGKKISALFLALAMAIGMCAVPAWADEDTKTLAKSDSFYTDKGLTLTASDRIRVKSSARKGFAVFDASTLSVSDGTWQEYLANAPSVFFSLTQQTYAGSYTCSVDGISENKANYSITNSSFTSADFTAGTEIAKFFGTGKGDVFMLDVTQYVKQQTDGILVFKVNGDTSNTTAEMRFDTLTLTFDYSDTGKVAAAKRNISLEDTYEEDFTLPTEGEYGSTISWSSDNNAISVDENGNATVTQSEEDACTVTLTASITLNETVDTKEFTVSVPKLKNADFYNVIASADTYIQNGTNYNDSNYNNQQKLYLNGSGRQNFLRFEQNAVSTDEILNAKLYLYYTGKTGTTQTTFYLYGLSGTEKTSWQEDTLTTNIAVEVGLFDSTAESLGAGSYLLWSQVENDSEAQWICLDVTDYVRQQSDGVYAFRLYGSTAKANFSSREISGQEPYLQLAKGDSGAVLSDVEKLNVPEKCYDSFSLPTTGENGSNISWTSDNEAITVADGEAQTAKVSENTAVTLTAVSAKAR